MSERPHAESEPSKGDAPDRLGPGQLYRFAWYFYLVLAAAAALWIGWREGSIALELFVDRTEWWLDLLLGTAVGLTLVVLWEIARRALPAAQKLTDALAEALGPLGQAEVIGLALLSGFAEELLFRGAIQGSLGVLAATLLFALMHTGPGGSFRLWPVFALVAGGLFGALVLWRGNLLPAITAHVVVNAINLGRLAAQQPAPAKGVSSG